MKIGIDVSQVIYGTGVSFYTKSLVKHLLEVDRENNYLLCGGSLRRLPELYRFAKSLKGNFKTRFLPLPPKATDFIWNVVHFPKVELLTGKIDVFHTSDWTQPPTNAFNVTTVHDLAPLKFPKLTDPGIVAVHKRRLKWVVKEADRIIVPSQSTRVDLAEFGADQGKIRIIPEAPGDLFCSRKAENVESLKKRFNIHGKYLLSVGVGPRKNTERIIKAFEGVKPDYDLTLVIVGPLRFKYEAGRGVRFTGQLKDEELAAFYHGAEALVYPSLYEGFGIPILQAFACGCPVVTSNVSSMHELEAGAGVAVDPYDAEAIKNGIVEALENRKELIKKGFERAKLYSWDKSAQMTLDVYKEALK